MSNVRLQGNKVAKLWQVIFAIAVVAVCFNVFTINSSGKSSGSKSTMSRLPSGITKIELPGSNSRTEDTGSYVAAADISGGKMYIARQGGFRIVDLARPAVFKYVQYDRKYCLGGEPGMLRLEGNTLWVRPGNTGMLCTYDIKTGKWGNFPHWTVTEHTGPGLFARREGDRIFYSAEGSPYYQGLNVMRYYKIRGVAAWRWESCYKSKPLTAFHADQQHFWMGVSQGILRITRATGEYRFFQATEHGGGARINRILNIHGRLMVATSGSVYGVLGDRTDVDRDGITVYLKNGKKIRYDNDSRETLASDVELGRVYIRNITVTPGLLVKKGEKWQLIGRAAGLRAGDVNDFAGDEKFIYLVDGRRLAILDKHLKVLKLNPAVDAAIKGLHRVVPTEGGIVCFTTKGILKVDRISLTGSTN